MTGQFVPFCRGAMDELDSKTDDQIGERIIVCERLWL